jgi:glycerophosphoryl diester phosphodiesterase
VPVRHATSVVARAIAAAPVLGAVSVSVGATPAAARRAGCVAPPVAHRGDSSRAPENTIPAFRKALREGAVRLEVDVRFTADDVPVAMHDATVRRTTDGNGRVADLRLGDVRSLDAGSWFAPQYAGVRVPTLFQVLRFGRSRGAWFLVELKVRPTTQQMHNFLNRLRWLGMLPRVKVTSFDAQTVLDVRAAQPGLATALIDARGFRPPQDVLRYGRTYLVHYWSVTRARSDQWRAAGIEVRPWTVNRVAGWKRMAYDGAGPVITDRPKRYVSWARSFCS